MIFTRLSIIIDNNIHKYIHINNNLSTNKNYNASKLWDSNDILNRRISQDAESPGQHSVVCTVNTQSVCNEACHYTNKQPLVSHEFLQVIQSVSQNVQLCVCLYFSLTDRKMDMSIHYLHIYWPKQHLQQTCLNKSLLDWIN